MNKMRLLKDLRKVTVLLVLSLFIAPPAFADPGNADNGHAIYLKKCWWCHGKEGEADGPGSKFMIPPPRNFAEGIYKYKTSPPANEIVRDEDIFNMISDGMPGTSMPPWKDVLKKQERWDLVAFIKNKLTDMFEDEPNPPSIDYSKKIVSSPESIEKGMKAFDAAKCWECHGRAGKGDTMKKLKEDTKHRVWPRNFTKPWTFRGGYTAESIFSRVTAGIPNTPMISFAAPETGNGKLSEEDRWHVTNYVMSLADPDRQTKEGQIVVKGAPLASLPADENAEEWNAIAGTAFFLVPQMIKKDRFFIPSNDLISVKAAFTDKDIAFLIEIDDRTKSIAGDAIAAAIAWDGLTPDALAIQTPVVIPTTSKKPYFGHGDGSNAVSMLYWNSGSVEKQNVSKMLKTTGTGAREESDSAAAGFTTSASYKDGTWKVMMKRSLTTPNTESDTQFEVGKYIPIAFANWDGSNGEVGPKHTLTTWRWLLLKPETGSQVVTFPLGVFLVLVVGQFMFGAFLRKNRE